MYKNRVENYTFLALLAGVSILLFFVFAPFIQILTLAAVLAILFHKPYERLTRELYGFKSIAAIIIVVLVLIFVIVPLFFLGTQIFNEAQSIYAGARGNGAQYIQTVQTMIQNPIHRIFPTFSFDIGAWVGNALAFISSNLASIVSQTFYVMLETFLMLLAFFFFLRDGRDMIAMISTSSPFGKDETHLILSNMRQTIQSIVKGTLVVALIRLLFIGLGFYFFNIPNAILWGSIGGIVGAIPGLGTLFAFIPAVAYLYLEGAHLSAVGLAIFGLVVMAVVDNILTPYFFGRGLAVPSIFVLFSILGGIIFFGPLGFILGPLVLSVFLSVFHLYSSTKREPDSS